MMGWRMGYLAYPPAIAPQLLKVQDTIPICPTQISQAAALGALGDGAGRPWVRERVAGLAGNLATMRTALRPLTDNGFPVIGGEGAIYLMCKLPGAYAEKDEAVVKWLAYVHGVCLIPGTACGAPGFVRVCFANLPSDTFEEACRRLHAGLEVIVAGDGKGGAADLSC
jgi:katanin p60 ATPase-containing subunit A1